MGFVKERLNKRLCFAGLELSESGKFREIESIFTITDAEYRASRFRKKLEQRETHYRIYEFCNAELLNENYFHSVFEAVKSVFEVIRMKSGLSVDGNLLIEQAFSINNPLIQINSLSNGTGIFY